ncbi:hypothetical protein BDY21DRAFT_366229 [Lineolata rhizophorae]|uniref:Uncharacterized protein n=1 Tax=Lineolata rhizophorae TaxID=578093 RepID=A0A6A6NSR1_9PEZI|nr:hypothetical protein BDY21DRAFT_366229 [Lineolata rhizophorae]
MCRPLPHRWMVGLVRGPPIVKGEWFVWEKLGVFLYASPSPDNSRGWLSVVAALLAIPRYRRPSLAKPAEPVARLAAYMEIDGGSRRGPSLDLAAWERPVPSSGAGRLAGSGSPVTTTSVSPVYVVRRPEPSSSPARIRCLLQAMPDTTQVTTTAVAFCTRPHNHALFPSFAGTMPPSPEVPITAERAPLTVRLGRFDGRGGGLNGGKLAGHGEPAGRPDAQPVPFGGVAPLLACHAGLPTCPGCLLPGYHGGARRARVRAPFSTLHPASKATASDGALPRIASEEERRARLGYGQHLFDRRARGIATRRRTPGGLAPSSAAGGAVPGRRRAGEPSERRAAAGLRLREGARGLGLRSRDGDLPADETIGQIGEMRYVARDRTNSEAFKTTLQHAHAYARAADNGSGPRPRPPSSLQRGLIYLFVSSHPLGRSGLRA